MDDDHLSMWVIYDHPNDYPNDFVAREWHVKAARVESSPVTVFKAPNLEAVRRFVQTVVPSGVRLNRAHDDDPAIVETWV